MRVVKNCVVRVNNIAGVSILAMQDPYECVSDTEEELVQELCRQQVIDNEEELDVKLLALDVAVHPTEASLLDLLRSFHNTPEEEEDEDVDIEKISNTLKSSFQDQQVIVNEQEAIIKLPPLDAAVHPTEVSLLALFRGSPNTAEGEEEDIDIEEISDESVSSFQGRIHLLLLQAEEGLKDHESDSVSSNSESNNSVGSCFHGFSSGEVPRRWKKAFSVSWREN